MPVGGSGSNFWEGVYIPFSGLKWAAWAAPMPIGTVWKTPTPHSLDDLISRLVEISSRVEEQLPDAR